MITMKNFNSDDELPLNKTIEIPSMAIAVRATFLENNKFYPQVFLDECLYMLQIRTRTWKLNRMTKLSNTTKKQKYNLRNKKCLYFTCFFINYYYIIDSYNYLLLYDKV